MGLGVEFLVCGLGDEHSVAVGRGELLDLVFEHLQGEHLTRRMRHDEVHGPGDLACRDAVGDLRPARDDDGRVFDFLRDMEDHWDLVIIIPTTREQHLHHQRSLES